jgi:hypothetical protein
VRVWQAAFAALLTLGLSACVSLPHPIGTSVGFRNDPALAGLWYGKSDKEDSSAGYYHVLLNADDTMTLVGVAAQAANPEKGGGWVVLTATTVALGGNHYINGREIFEDGKPKDDATLYSGYYTIRDDTVTIYALDDRKVAAEIKAHRIAGTITQGRFGQDVAITAGAADVDRWLSSPRAPALFTPLFSLRRVKEPQPPPPLH